MDEGYKKNATHHKVGGGFEAVNTASSGRGVVWREATRHSPTTALELWLPSFVVYTKTQAKRALAYYRRYSDNALRPLRWTIQPITRKQYSEEIWNELLF